MYFAQLPGGSQTMPMYSPKVLLVAPVNHEHLVERRQPGSAINNPHRVLEVEHAEPRPEGSPVGDPGPKRLQPGRQVLADLAARAEGMPPLLHGEVASKGTRVFRSPQQFRWRSLAAPWILAHLLQELPGPRNPPGGELACPHFPCHARLYPSRALTLSAENAATTSSIQRSACAT